MSTDTTFTPVPVRARHDGWTPARQHAFVAALHDSRCVTAACRAVGMSWQTAYRLRARPDAGGFAAAWDAALAGPDLARPVAGRAIDGIATPITYRGLQVDEQRRFDDRLAMFLLRLRCPDRFGSEPPVRDPVASDEYAPAPCEAEADFPADVSSSSSPSAASAKAHPLPSPAKPEPRSGLTRHRGPSPYRRRRNRTPASAGEASMARSTQPR